MSHKTLTFAMMDAPYESARITTVFRLMDIAARRGYTINVFAYEGAVGLPFAEQKPHPNAVHGHDATEKNHPLPKDWIAALFREAEAHGGSLNWVNCGLCVDERGVNESINGIHRGTPGDFLTMATASDNTLVIGTT